MRETAFGRLFAGLKAEKSRPVNDSTSTSPSQDSQGCVQDFGEQRAWVREVLAQSATKPVALIRRQHSSLVDVLAGRVVEVETLAEIPLTGQEVLALVPFRQVRERGFTARDDGAPLLCLLVEERASLPQSDLLELLPQEIPLVEPTGFDLSDEDYAQVVRRVISDEIGRGEGANFVIRRDFHSHTTAHPKTALLAWFKDLLTHEVGAYWTFAFITDEVLAVGASPERHVSSTNQVVFMNPISGTLRHGGKTPDVETLLTFLQDRKESEELVMVVDEELKMMSAICPEGGVMRGPFLKPMTQLTHTEYLLEGKTELDPREVLRLTMFAPTVTGSPMGNACRVIARHETTGRGYYSGVIARFTPRVTVREGAGSQVHPTDYDLDAPILIRTAFVNPAGDIVASAGATLVRHSDPMSEAAETRAKASGVLASLGLVERSITKPVNVVNAAGSGGAGTPTGNSNNSNTDVTTVTAEATEKATKVEAVAYPAAKDPQVLQALADRNRNLAPFWRDEQISATEFSASAILVDCGDDFTTMLAHQLRRLGLNPRIVHWSELPENPEADLVVFGPGPGDPTDDADPRIQRVSQRLRVRVEAGLPTLAVCLSHQVLCRLAGLEIVELPSPRQGLPLQIPLLGKKCLIGFYNTFTARGKNGQITENLELTINSDPQTGDVFSLLGRRVASVQGHLESVLSYDGFSALAGLVHHALQGWD